MDEYLYAHSVGATNKTPRSRRRRPQPPYVSDEELAPRYITRDPDGTALVVHGGIVFVRGFGWRMGTNETLSQAAKRVGWAR